MNRRRFLGTLATACAATAFVPTRVSANGAKGAPRLDCHVHISSPRMAEAVERVFGRHPFPTLGAQQVIERLDGDGIERAWVLSEAYMMASEVRSFGDASDERARVEHENDFVVRESGRFGKRLVPFLSLNPKRDYAVAEIDRCVERGARGLKLHCWNSLVDVRDERQRATLREVLAHAASRKLPVLVHAFNGSVRGYGKEDAEIWARELVLPIERLKVCFAHLGGAGGFDPPVQEVLATLVEHLGPGSPAADRVRIDMSAVLVGPNELGFPPTPPSQKERMVDLLGAWDCRRVLWGSDSIPGYLELSRGAWPLGDEAWAVVCRQEGKRMVA